MLDVDYVDIHRLISWVTRAEHVIATWFKFGSRVTLSVALRCLLLSSSLVRLRLTPDTPTLSRRPALRSTVLLCWTTAIWVSVGDVETSLLRHDVNVVALQLVCRPSRSISSPCLTRGQHRL